MTLIEKIILGCILIGIASFLYGLIKLIEWDLKRRRKGMYRAVKCLHCGLHPEDYQKDDECKHLTYTEEL